MNIYQIEITNQCQFNCSYCPRTNHMTRQIGTITTEIIDNIYNKITSNEVRLHHYGESLLEKSILFYSIKKLSKKVKIYLNTNGELLDKDTAINLFSSGIEKVFLSYHNKKSLKFINDIPNEYRKNIHILSFRYNPDLHKLKEKGYVIELKRLRDLGQIRTKDKLDHWKKCSFIKNNEVVITWDGTIVTCCEVFNNEREEILGNILNTNKIINRKIPKCNSCLGYSNDYSNDTEKVNLDDYKE